jgi:hypothetical protein
VDKAASAPVPKDAIFALASMTNYLPELKDMKVATPRCIEPAHRQPTLQDMHKHRQRPREIRDVFP